MTAATGPTKLQMKYVSVLSQQLQVRKNVTDVTKKHISDIEQIQNFTKDGFHTYKKLSTSLSLSPLKMHFYLSAIAQLLVTLYLLRLCRLTDGLSRSPGGPPQLIYPQ